MDPACLPSISAAGAPTVLVLCASQHDALAANVNPRMCAPPARKRCWRQNHAQRRDTATRATRGSRQSTRGSLSSSSYVRCFGHGRSNPGTLSGTRAGSRLRRRYEPVLNLRSRSHTCAKGCDFRTEVRDHWLRPVCASHASCVSEPPSTSQEVAVLRRISRVSAYLLWCLQPRWSEREQRLYRLH
jgi:hypothetical protein